MPANSDGSNGNTKAVSSLAPKEVIKEWLWSLHLASEQRSFSKVILVLLDCEEVKTQGGGGATISTKPLRRTQITANGNCRKDVTSVVFSTDSVLNLLKV